jgi:hypothetical protein
MHRAKKLAVTATAAALLSATGMSSAMAVRPGGNDDNVTICHLTSRPVNPYNLITVDENAVDNEGVGHAGHEGDIIPAPEDANGRPFCPPTPPPPDGEEPPGEEPEDDADCTASSSSGTTTQSQSGLINVGNLNLGLNNLLGNGLCQSNVGNGLGLGILGTALGGLVDDDDSGDGDCTASSVSGDTDQDQSGLINVGNLNLGLNNLLGNGLCGSNVLNGVAAAVLGGAVGGDLVDGAGDGDCLASSVSGDTDQVQEDGLLNVGNLNLGLNNLLGNTLCQSDVLNGLAVSVLGTAVGGGSGLLSGGPLGLLSGVGYLVPSVLADVDVVAGLLVIL